LIETIEGQSPHKNKTPKVLLHQTLMNFKPTSIQQALDGLNALFGSKPFKLSWIL